MTARNLDIVFDGPPGPEAGRFVEVEVDGKSVNAGKWVERDDGLWELQIREPVAAPPEYLENEADGPYQESRRAQYARDVLSCLRSILAADPDGLEAQLDAMGEADDKSLSIGTGEVFCHMVSLMLTRGAPPPIVIQQFQRALATAMEIVAAKEQREEAEEEATH